MYDSYRQVHLGVYHVLRVQLLHHAVGDELVILSGAQALGYRFEGQKKAGEVAVLIERAGFFLGEHPPAALEVAVAIVGGLQRGGMAAA